MKNVPNAKYGPIVPYGLKDVAFYGCLNNTQLHPPLQPMMVDGPNSATNNLLLSCISCSFSIHSIEN